MDYGIRGISGSESSKERSFVQALDRMNELVCRSGDLVELSRAMISAFNMENLEALMEELGKRSPNESKFTMTEYCSLENIQELLTVNDKFSRAMLRENGATDLDILKRDIREFLSRNRLSERNIVEYKRCKEGYGGMSGEEYFYLNYCYINGRLPIKYSPVIFGRYKENVKLKRIIWQRKSISVKDEDLLEQPKTPEQCFRLKDKL